MNSTSSKAQIPQMFIFIMAMLVIGATIFLGMKLLDGLQDTACSANDASFQQELKRQLDTYAEFGSRDQVAIKPPCDAIALCFVDTRALSGTFSDRDLTINASVNARVRTNVFLKGRDGTTEAAYDPRIYLTSKDEGTILDHAICVEGKGGRFTFNTEGYGRYVIITKP